MNSIEIAENFDKKHKDVLRTIRTLIKRNPETEKYFIKSSYIASNGKSNPMYQLSSEGENILHQKFQFNIRSARFEYKMLNEICDFLDLLNIAYEKQYPILKYRIDLYIPQFNVAIEYDEKEHEQKREYDYRRQKEIEQVTGFKFFRIKEDETVGTVIAKITKQIMSEVNICERKAV